MNTENMQEMKKVKRKQLMNAEKMQEKKKGNKLKKILNIVINVLLSIFFVLALFLLIIFLFSKKEDGAVPIFGKEMRIVTSWSMEPDENTDVSNYEIKSINYHSAIFIDLVPEDEEAALVWFDNLKVGDVLTFKAVEYNYEIVTHRLVKKEKNADGSYVLYLKGDHGDEKGQKIENTYTGSLYVVGKVEGQSVVLGNVISFIKEPLGIVLIIIVPCGLIMIYEIIKIVVILRKDREEKHHLETEEKQDEIERLKAELEKLKQKEGENENGS